VTDYRLGINTCFAVKRWPRPQDWAPIVRDDLGLTLVQHSFDLVDLDVDADRDGQAAELAATCRAAGLTLHSTFTGLAAYSSNLLLHPDDTTRRRAEAWYRRAIDLTAAAGATATGGHVGAWSVADWRRPDRRRALLTSLQGALERLAAHARTVGVDTLYVENLAAEREPSTMDGIRHLLRPPDPDHAAVALCLDVGHQCVPHTSGIERDPYEWLRRMGAVAPIVQLQQSDATADHHWPFTATTNAAGRIVAADVLAALDASGATEVDLILEIIPPFEADDDEVRADLVASAEHWRQALDAHVAARP